MPIWDKNRKELVMYPSGAARAVGGGHRMLGRLRRVAVAVADRRRSAGASGRGRDEAGYTLVEIVIAMGLLVVALGALMDPLLISQHAQARNANYAYAQQDAGAGVTSMVSQIRQATEIIASGPNSVEMNVTLGGSPQLVFYECDIAQSGTSYRECVRVSTTQGGTLPPLSAGTIVVQNLLNGTTSDPVFSWGPDPSAPYYMTATVDVPSSDGQQFSGLNHALVFSDGALMRNLNVGA
jgi:hypothetical protein